MTQKSLRHLGPFDSPRAQRDAEDSPYPQGDARTVKRGSCF